MTLLCSTNSVAAALGVRLGVPKPGIRMAPPELLESVLGVKDNYVLCFMRE